MKIIIQKPRKIWIASKLQLSKNMIRNKLWEGIK